MTVGFPFAAFMPVNRPAESGKARDFGKSFASDSVISFDPPVERTTQRRVDLESLEWNTLVQGGPIMFAGNNTLKVVMGLTATLALSALTGCGESQKTTSIDVQAQQFAMAPNSGSLGAGDSLGAQVFSTSDDTVRMAVIRQTESAVAVAEAKAKDGTYEQWYASFDRDPGHIRLAKARQAQDDGLQPSKSTTDTYTDAPIPEPVR